MPPIVNLKKCTGCQGRDEAFCENICPGDLMTVDPKTGKAYCRSTKECWDCMSCVKACPHGALETKIPYQIGYYKATLKPYVGKTSVIWKCTDILGNETTYKTKKRNH